MERQACRVRVISRQKMGPDTDETIEEMKGAFLERGGKKYISYKRSFEGGSCDVLLTVTMTQLLQAQQGDIISRMEFVAGQRTINTYQTPMGKLDLSIFTRRYSVKQVKNSLTIDMEYDLITGAEPIATHMIIEVELPADYAEVL